jgi:hypothetical protein
VRRRGSIYARLARETALNESSIRRFEKGRCGTTVYLCSRFASTPCRGSIMNAALAKREMMNDNLPP